MLVLVLVELVLNIFLDCCVLLWKFTIYRHKYRPFLKNVLEFFFNQSSVAHYFKDIIKTYFESVKRGNYIHIFQQYQNYYYWKNCRDSIGFFVKLVILSKKCTRDHILFCYCSSNDSWIHIRQGAYKVTGKVTDLKS